MEKNVDLIIITGELSGDAHGALLVQKLRKKNPNLRIYAVGGPKMRFEKIPQLFPMEKLSAMGFSDLLVSLPKIAYWFYFLRRKILQLKPKAVVCIDFPGFHLRLQRSLRKKGYKGKLIQYVCPSIWAWSKNRKQVMEKNLDLLLTIFPFEEKIFTNSCLQAKYVGNPSHESCLAYKKNPHFFAAYTNATPIVALFPGSRKKEIIRNLPLQILAAKELAFSPVIACAEKKLQPLIEDCLNKQGVCADIIFSNHKYDLMEKASVAIATSGTVTLELAFFQTPTLVTFGMSIKDYLIAAKIAKIDLPFYCIVNILENKEIFPELFGPNFTPAKIKYWAKNWLGNQEQQNLCKKRLKKFKKEWASSSCPVEESILFEIGV